MEHLNKQQVILLCLLVALFTSIATSVITASLMDTSSTGVGQTIYKVVERTIQEVAPKDSTVGKIVEKKDELKEQPLPSLSQIVEKANESLVSVWRKDREGKGVYVTLGAVVGAKNSVIVFDGSSIFEKVKYTVKLSQNKEVEMIKSDMIIGEGLALLIYEKDQKDTQKLSGMNLSTLAEEKLASNVIALGAKGESNVVSTGIITEFPFADATATTTNKGYAVTDIKLSTPSSGWILLNSSGKVVGFLSAPVEGDKGARYVNAEKILVAGKDFF